MKFLATLLSSLWYLAAAIADSIAGRRRKSYEIRLFIAAPRETVWQVMTANRIRFDEAVPVEIEVAPRPGDPSVREGTIKVGDLVLRLAYREIAIKPGEAAVTQLLSEDSDPGMVPGEDYFISYTLAPAEGGMSMLLTHELTHTTFFGRIAVPVGARASAERIKRYCEGLAGTATPAATSPISDAVTTGLLTYVSFLFLVGPSAAAMLIGLVLIHELGHVLAMRWVGQPVRGIYFVPFLGGVAVASAPHDSEADRGLVALMGPGLSILTTALFLVLGNTTGYEIYGELALLSAILNGINLAPMLPLDGGHVSGALLSGWDPEYAGILTMLLLMGGVGLALYLGLYVMAGLCGLVALAELFHTAPRRTLLPISTTEAIWLAAAYAATLAFYAAVVLGYLL